MTAETRTARSPARHQKPLLLAGLAALFVLFASLALGWQALNAVPAVAIPTPAMPSPNAHDSFTRATTLLREPGRIGTVADDFRSEKPGDRAKAMTEARSLLLKNRPALAALREGLPYVYQEPPARSFTVTFPYMAGYRNLARLLQIEAKVRGADGDAVGAMTARLDALQFGGKIPHGSVLIGRLVGIAVQAIGLAGTWERVDHLSAAQARAAARRLERVLDEATPYAETIAEEKWCTEAGMLELWRKPNWQAQLVAMNSGFPGGSSGNGLETWVKTLPMLLVSKRSILKNHAAFMDREIANARLPFATHAPSAPVPQDPVNRLLLPMFTQARFISEKNDAMLRLLAVRLALRAYRAERGADPPSLQALVPAYLKRLPDDPFAKQGPLAYRRTATGHVLYSLGPDCADDRGKPIDNPRAPGRSSAPYPARYRVESNSTGDIVAGVNY